MAKLTINTGTVANDGTGDSIRESFNKTNSNFTELYSWGDHSLAGYITTVEAADFLNSPAFGITSLNISQWNDAYNWGDHSAAGYIDDTQDIIPAINNLYDLGSNNFRFKDLYLSGDAIYFGGNIITSSNTGVSIPYTPSDAGNWANTAPTTVEEALNRIAAAIGPIG